ncbi:MAG: hypothetical protein LBK60_08905 [Verrucomicrobiales bacterium]|nr:hypothetical protein [Verrucomicrobiales bacterium]
MNNIKKSILAGLVFGLLIAVWLMLLQLTWAPTGLLTTGIIAGVGGGVLFGVGIYWFVTSKTVHQQTQIPLADGEPVIHSGGANHFHNGEAVGGKLWLLTDRLQFRLHQFNLQNHELVIPLAQIKEVIFSNTLGVVPNGLLIVTTAGACERFVVSGRRWWKSRIEALRPCR